MRILRLRLAWCALFGDRFEMRQLLCEWDDRAEGRIAR